MLLIYGYLFKYIELYMLICFTAFFQNSLWSRGGEGLAHELGRPAKLSCVALPRHQG